MFNGQKEISLLVCKVCFFSPKVWGSMADNRHTRPTSSGSGFSTEELTEGHWLGSRSLASGARGQLQQPTMRPSSGERQLADVFLSNVSDFFVVSFKFSKRTHERTKQTTSTRFFFQRILR